MKPKIVTIGVYGFDKDNFFQALLNANIDTFCDIRLRRGIRGSIYSFANSESLQRHLSELGIRYVHIKDLAPNQEVRKKQKQEDEKLGVAKRSRKGLSQAFIQAYEKECLSNFDSSKFISDIGPEAKIIGLFCVEREPDACHRSLAAKKLAQDLNLLVENVIPL